MAAKPPITAIRKGREFRKPSGRQVRSQDCTRGREGKVHVVEFGSQKPEIRAEFPDSCCKGQ